MKVHSIFYTVQGEGLFCGRAAVFVRFAGCNLWSGLERDRSKLCSAWCDTDFVGGSKMTEESVVSRVQDACGGRPALVVLTGGEPGLQATEALVGLLHASGHDVMIETNGTVPLPANLDTVCVSPKSPAFLITKGDELKVVYPQGWVDLDTLLETTAFSRYSLQPLDNADLVENTRLCVERVKMDPRWVLGTQAHKQWNIE